MNAVPEMIWVKERTGNESWHVYHKGLNGGTDLGHYHLLLNDIGAEANAAYTWNDTAPTATVFSLATDASTNGQSKKYLAMLFASVDGISKVGSYTGDGTSDGSTAITTGFQPRFILIKSSSNSNRNWNVLDSTRGMSTGSDEKVLYLNSNAAQTTSDIVDISSTGFAFQSSQNDINASGLKYIYYAHA